VARAAKLRLMPPRLGAARWEHGKRLKERVGHGDYVAHSRQGALTLVSSRRPAVDLTCRKALRELSFDEVSVVRARLLQYACFLPFLGLACGSDSARSPAAANGGGVGAGGFVAGTGGVTGAGGGDAGGGGAQGGNAGASTGGAGIGPSGGAGGAFSDAS